LRPSIVFAGFRPFAPVFGFRQRNVTQNDTQHGQLGNLLCRNPFDLTSS
jgi:hypothetical protein